MVRSGVVEVDHQADTASRHPHADPDTVVLRAHQVRVMTAAVRLLALVEQVRRENGGFGATAAAADILGPRVVVVSGAAEAIARAAADEMAAIGADREPLGVRPRDLRADTGIELERCDVASARAAAGTRRGDPATGPGAVHESEVVGFDRSPAAAADRAAAGDGDRLRPARRRVAGRRGPGARGLEDALLSGREVHTGGVFGNPRDHPRPRHSRWG